MATKSVRTLRYMLVAAIVFTGLATGSAYLAKRRIAKTQVNPPKRIPEAVNQEAHGFAISRTEGDKTIFKATAKKAVDFRETGKSQLEEVEIIIYGAAGDRNDRISSKSCEYDSNTGRFYSEGEVLIQLSSLPGAGTKGKDPKVKQIEAATAGKPVIVKTSGLLFDQKAGIASTDRDLLFEFRQGRGQAKGAIYDSGQQSLLLKSNVMLHAEGKHSGKATDIHAAELRYMQREQQIQLAKPQITQEEDTVAADKGTLYLDEKQQATSALLEGAVHVKTTDKGRNTEFSTTRLELNLDDKQQVTSAYATGDVRMDSTAANGRTQGRAARLEMDLSGPKNSLKQAQWKGGAVLSLLPPATPATNQARAQTRTISAEQIEMTMKPDGKELANARTLTPGKIEMTGGSDPRRVMTARTIWAEFGERSSIRELRASGQTRTETDPPAKPANPPPGWTSGSPRITTSEELSASFNAQQQIETLVQSGVFRYREGDRQASAEQALYAAQSSTTFLTGKPGEDPQVWDADGRVIAKRFTLPDKSGEAIAEGDVRATHVQSKDPNGDKQRSAIFAGAAAKDQGKKSGDEPVHALTNKLRWDRKTGISHYEGGPSGKARLWQGQDILEARTVEMERTGKKLTAAGDVYSYLVEEGKQPLRVTSQRLNYNDEDRHARYEGSVNMHSEDMTLTSASVDVWLREASDMGPGESRVERAQADGKVRMNQPARKASGKKKAAPARQAEAEHAVFTSDDEKIVLTGGPPVVRDDVRGLTTGRELTWLTSDDKIFVDSGPDVRSQTQHRVTKKPR